MVLMTWKTYFQIWFKLRFFFPSSTKIKKKRRRRILPLKMMIPAKKLGLAGARHVKIQTQKKKKKNIIGW